MLDDYTDPKRKTMSDGILKYLPTVTPRMKEAQKAFVIRQIDFQKFQQICENELQDLKRRQEETEY